MNNKVLIFIAVTTISLTLGILLGVQAGSNKYDTALYNCRLKYDVYRCVLQPLQKKQE